MLLTAVTLNYEAIPHNDDVTDYQVYEIITTLINNRLAVADGMVIESVTMNYSIEKPSTIIVGIVSLQEKGKNPDVIEIQTEDSGKLIYLHKLNLETTSF